MKSLPIRSRKNAKNKTKSKPEFNPPINLSDIDASNFDIDKKISELANKSFRIDNLEKFILLNIAEGEPQNEKQVYKLRHLRDLVRYRLNSRNNNPNGMIERGFLVKKQGERIGNLPDRYEKIYRLTLKGFLASLTTVKFDDNYLVKKYEQFISTQTSNPILAKFALLIIKYNVALFLFDTVLNAVDLAALDNIGSKILKMNQGFYVDPTISHRIRDPLRADLLSSIRFWFHVYSQIFNKMTKIIIEDNLENKGRNLAVFAESSLPNLIKFWYYYLPRFPYDDDLHSFDPDADTPVSSTLDIREMDVNVRSVNLMAKQILEKYDIPTNFPPDDPPKFF